MCVNKHGSFNPAQENNALRERTDRENLDRKMNIQRPLRPNGDQGCSISGLPYFIIYRWELVNISNEGRILQGEEG